MDALFLGLHKTLSRDDLSNGKNDSTSALMFAFCSAPSSAGPAVAAGTVGVLDAAAKWVRELPIPSHWSSSS